MSSDAESQEELISRAINGDQSAMQALLLPEYERIHRYASGKIDRYLRGVIGPEDIVQDVTVLAIRNARSFRPLGPDSFSRWTITIAKHRIREIIRFCKAMELRNELVSKPDVSGKTTFDPLKAAIRRERYQAVHRAISALRDDQRTAVTLRFFQKLSFKEVAAQMGRSDRSVQMLCQRAFIELRASLSNLTRRPINSIADKI